MGGVAAGSLAAPPAAATELCSQGTVLSLSPCTTSSPAYNVLHLPVSDPPTVQPHAQACFEEAFPGLPYVPLTDSACLFGVRLPTGMKFLKDTCFLLTKLPLPMDSTGLGMQ